jgi:hypothetical protein
MADLFQGLRSLHIAAGAAALLLFWIPVAAPKGGRLHIRIGWTYVVCMSVVVLTAFSMSGMAFLDPLGVRRFAQPLPVEEVARFVTASRVFAVFLAYLAGVTLVSGWQGVWALRTRRDPRSLRKPFAVALNVLVGLSGLAILVLGIRRGSTPLVGLSPIGPFIALGNLRYIQSGPRSRMGWWYEHLSSMLGTGIAAYTAFLVFGGSRLFPTISGSPYYPVFWVLPSILGVPAIFLTVAYYRRKFRGNDQSTVSRMSEAKPAV